MSWFWFGLGIFLGIGELLTREYLLLWVALGAFVAGISALALPFVYQLMIFLMTSLSLTVSFKKNKRRAPDILVGKKAIVVETVQRVYCDRGLIEIDGEIWRAYCDQNEIFKGTVVTIIEVHGNRLKVES